MNVILGRGTIAFKLMRPLRRRYAGAWARQRCSKAVMLCLELQYKGVDEEKLKLSAQNICPATKLNIKMDLATIFPAERFFFSSFFSLFNHHAKAAVRIINKKFGLTSI
jgi:hypothetical protein